MALGSIFETNFDVKVTRKEVREDKNTIEEALYKLATASQTGRSDVEYSDIYNAYINDDPGLNDCLFFEVGSKDLMQNILNHRVTHQAGTYVKEIEAYLR